jgi:hypothetical protein
MILYKYKGFLQGKASARQEHFSLLRYEVPCRAWPPTSGATRCFTTPSRAARCHHRCRTIRSHADEHAYANTPAYDMWVRPPHDSRAFSLECREPPLPSTPPAHFFPKRIRSTTASLAAASSSHTPRSFRKSAASADASPSRLLPASPSPPPAPERSPLRHRPILPRPTAPASPAAPPAPVPTRRPRLPL